MQVFAKIPVYCAFMKANMNATDSSRKSCRPDTFSAKTRALISEQFWSDNKGLNLPWGIMS